MNYPDGQLPCEDTLEWRGCYSGQYDLWTTESFSHPAKMAPGLAFRILAHLEEIGLIEPGDTILDPMCGIGTSLLTACVKGYASVGIELEAKFVSLAQANADRLAAKGFPAPIAIIQGDARYLSELLKERGYVAMTSPPYQDITIRHLEESAGKAWRDKQKGAHDNPTGYGSTPGQIGTMKDKPLKAITSPPWNLQSGGRGEASRSSTPDGGLIDRHGGGIKGGMGSSPGNIGNLPDKPLKAVMSPPYGEAHKADSSPGGILDTNRQDLQDWVWTRGRQGKSTGQIANLPDRPLKAITSPPWEDSGFGKSNKYSGNVVKSNQQVVSRNRPVHIAPGEKAHQIRYADQIESNIAQEQGETYLSAMAQVYAEIAKVADVLVVVTKNPTRAGKLRRLDLDTIALLEATGWKIHCQHRALLFEEQEQGHLFEGSQKRTRGRLSFFKRLSWQKGSPVAQWEDIIVAVRKV